MSMINWSTMPTVTTTGPSQADYQDLLRQIELDRTRTPVKTTPGYNFETDFFKTQAPSNAGGGTGTTSWGSVAAGISGAGGLLGGLLGMYEAKRNGQRAAAAYNRQAGLYEKQGDIYGMSAEAYGRSAATAISVGKANARNLRLSASMLQRYEDLAVEAAAKEARARIGAGRAGYAANGVLVDSGSAAMWEQDEAADAAIEILDIQQQFEDQGWSYRLQANQAEAAGYGRAAEFAGQAAGAYGQAYGSYLQAVESRRQATETKKDSKYQMISSGIAAITGAAALAALLL